MGSKQTEGKKEGTTKKQENSATLKSEEKRVGERWEKQRMRKRERERERERERDSHCQNVYFSRNLKVLLVVRGIK